MFKLDIIKKWKTSLKKTCNVLISQPSDETCYVTSKEVRQYFGLNKAGYNFDEYVDKMLMKLVDDYKNIGFIHKDKYYLSVYFNDNTTIQCWIANQVWGKAQMGKITKGDYEVHSWRSSQPSKQMMCYIDKLEKDESLNRSIFSLLLLNYNDELDNLFTLILDNIENVYIVIRDTSIHSISDKKYYKVIFNNKSCVVTSFANKDDRTSFGWGYALSDKGKVEYQWKDINPKAINMFKMMTFLKSPNDFSKKDDIIVMDENFMK
jgi:hypothetical protein